MLESKEEDAAELCKVNLNEPFEFEQLPVLARVPSTGKFENLESMHHAVQFKRSDTKFSCDVKNLLL